MSFRNVFLALLTYVLAHFARADGVPRWSVHEITLTSAGEFQNASAEVEVTADFTGPSGETKTVRSRRSPAATK